jgi:hypothetical protein
MTDLVIHIGLPKTGTTTIQNNVFAGLENYFGIYEREKKWAKSEGRKLMNLFAEYSSGRQIDEKLVEWTENIYEKKKEMSPRAEMVILSNENFFEGRLNHMPEFPLVECGYREVGQDITLTKFLRKLSSQIWTHGHVRIIITLRNQIEWIMSKYAQASAKIPDASQEDFERRLADFVRCDDSIWADWSQWVSQMHSVVGSENVCVLLIEEMHNYSYWSKLAQFIQVDEKNFSHLITKESRVEKKKRIDEKTWGLSKYSFAEDIGKRWSQSNYNLLRKLVIKSLKTHEKVISFTRYTISDELRSKLIHVSDDVQQKIKGYVGPSNVKLSKILGRDMEYLGYYYGEDDD